MWQGSSVGESARLIPVRSRVRISPLLFLFIFLTVFAVRCTAFWLRAIFAHGCSNTFVAANHFACLWGREERISPRNLKIKSLCSWFSKFLGIPTSKPLSKLKRKSLASLAIFINISHGIPRALHGFLVKSLLCTWLLKYFRSRKPFCLSVRSRVF